uniref:Uncharacterized protein n=1 Tax=Anguilla anguilla TaxID=7936 RepID=A0A0E9UPS8_ANGAN
MCSCVFGSPDVCLGCLMWVLKIPRTCTPSHFSVSMCPPVFYCMSHYV